MNDDSHFYEIEPSLENYWRAIILFGRNVASYKFALAKSLFDLRKSSTEIIRLDELAPFYAEHIVNHLKLCDKQITSSQSSFLDVCRSYGKDEISHNQLIEKTVKLGFNNVIDAFHNVHGNELDKRFFIDERKTNGGIRLTDNFFDLASTNIFDNLNFETEARWRLVETAWELNLPRQVVQITHDDSNQIFQTTTKQKRRINITPSRHALNGYQKGRCFYCFREVSLDEFSPDLPDVDHFFPHKLNYCADGKPIDGVANLVLSCKECNRGANGKFDRLPELKFLERLHKRNEYLIKSHHPLRETLMLQTGVTEAQRRDFLQNAYDCASSHLITKWMPKQCDISVF